MILLSCLTNCCWATITLLLFHQLLRLAWCLVVLIVESANRDLVEENLDSTYGHKIYESDAWIVVSALQISDHLNNVVCWGANVWDRKKDHQRVQTRLLALQPRTHYLHYVDQQDCLPNDEYSESHELGGDNPVGGRHKFCRLCIYIIKSTLSPFQEVVVNIVEVNVEQTVNYDADGPEQHDYIHAASFFVESLFI